MKKPRATRFPGVSGTMLCSPTDTIEPKLGHNGTYEFTISCWVYFDDATPSAAQTIWQVTANTTGTNYFYRLRLESLGGLRIVRRGTSSVTTSSADAITSDKKWHNIVWVNRAIDDTEVYLDGVSVVQATGSKSTANPCDNLSLGANASGGAELTGAMAHWTLWDEELTHAEISALAKGRHSTEVRPNGLKHYVSLGQGKARDESPRKAFQFTDTLTGGFAAFDGPPVEPRKPAIPAFAFGTFGEAAPEPSGVVPLGHHRLDNQYAAIAASRLNGVLQ